MRALRSNIVGPKALGRNAQHGAYPPEAFVGCHMGQRAPKIALSGDGKCSASVALNTADKTARRQGFGRRQAKPMNSACAARD